MRLAARHLRRSSSVSLAGGTGATKAILDDLYSLKIAPHSHTDEAKDAEKHKIRDKRKTLQGFDNIIEYVRKRCPPFIPPRSSTPGSPTATSASAVESGFQPRPSSTSSGNSLGREKDRGERFGSVSQPSSPRVRAQQGQGQGQLGSSAATRKQSQGQGPGAKQVKHPVSPSAAASNMGSASNQ